MVSSVQRQGCNDQEDTAEQHITTSNHSNVALKKLSLLSTKLLHT